MKDKGNKKARKIDARYINEKAWEEGKYDGRIVREYEEIDDGKGHGVVTYKLSAKNSRGDF
jgi:hypothetical protein